MAGELARVREQYSQLGARRFQLVAPVASAAEDALPQVVDLESVVRIDFPEPVLEEWAPSVETSEVDEKFTALRGKAMKVLGVETRESRPESDQSNKKAQAFADQLDTKLSEYLAEVRSVRAQLDSGLERKIAVEAFKQSGKTQSALALPGYNEIGSDKVDNREQPARRPIDPETRRQVRDLMARERKLLQDIDSSSDRERKSSVSSLAIQEAARKIRAEGAGVQLRDLANLLPTEVDLAANQFKRGDRLKLNVSRVTKDGDDEQRELLDSYLITADRLRWHGDRDVLTTFARGDQGDADAKDWNLNVAVGYTWSWYRTPDQQGGGWGTYSWFQPGLGVHLASLDMTDDDIEFGLGLHVSLWEGLLVIGTGTNLMADEDHQYYLIGGDLIAWKDELTKKD